MQKQAPSPARIAAMVAFALSCFALLLFLWVRFGGALPLAAQGYRVEASFAEATTLPVEADVRLAGVTIGKVKSKRLDRRAARTLVTLEIEPEFAPLRRGARTILRQKTLLGETYVEVAPGSRRAEPLADGGRLPEGNVEPTVELDEIFELFDEETRAAFRTWVSESAVAVDGGGGEDLNDALGNLEAFLGEGADVLGVLDERRRALRAFVRNTGVVFGALSRRRGELRSLISNSADTFDALASRDRALAETFAIFPTFLDESRRTLARLEGFSDRTRPLMRELKPVARDLGPTVRDLSALGPPLERLFDDLDALTAVSKAELPALVRVLRGAGPVVDRLHPFLQELNPMLSFANYDQQFLAHFINHASAAFGATLPPLHGGAPRHYLRAWGVINSRSLSLNRERPPYERGNAYPEPNTYIRAEKLGGIETFDCAPVGGGQRDPIDDGADERPPCFVMPGSVYDGGRFPTLDRAEAKLVPPPTLLEGPVPADPSR